MINKGTQHTFTKMILTELARSVALFLIGDLEDFSKVGSLLRVAEVVFVRKESRQGLVRYFLQLVNIQIQLPDVGGLLVIRLDDHTKNMIQQVKTLWE